MYEEIFWAWGAEVHYGKLVCREWGLLPHDSYKDTEKTLKWRQASEHIGKQRRSWWLLLSQTYNYYGLWQLMIWACGWHCKLSAWRLLFCLNIAIRICKHKKQCKFSYCLHCWVWVERRCHKKLHNFRKQCFGSFSDWGHLSVLYLKSQQTCQ